MASCKQGSIWQVVQQVGAAARWRTSGGATAAQVRLQGLRCIRGHSVQIGRMGVMAGGPLWNVALLDKLCDAPACGGQAQWGVVWPTAGWGGCVIDRKTGSQGWQGKLGRAMCKCGLQTERSS